MPIHIVTSRIWRSLVLLVFVVGIVAAAVPARPARAANHSIETGYYIGSGATKTISGVGFQPQLVIIKASNAATVAVFKTSAMPANAMGYLSATADTTTTAITFNSGGFVLSSLAAVNTANIHYTWTAFAGSDCSATGTMCVGTYTGDGAATKTLSTGFQPSIVIGKRSTAVAAHFRTASMAANRTEYFTSTAADTTGTLIQSFSTTGFTVGSADNASAGVYYYIAFKTVAGLNNEGMYTGDGVDNRDITTVGFKPALLLIKNSTSATVNNRRAVMSTSQNYGDSASYTADGVVNASNFIQQLQTTGFQIGSGLNTNESTFTHYWFALGGIDTLPAASGTFTMASGTYTGNGTSQTIASAGFAPDLVIIKDNAANYTIFRTSLMYGDTTSYLAVASANFTGGITGFTGTGFTVGAHATANTSGNTYSWQAFGNAYDPEVGSGAADFAIGSYVGTAVDNKQITAVPYQMDYVAVKSASATVAAQRSSAQTGDISGFFSAAAEAANTVQSLNSTGFEVGTNAINTSGALHNWFGFKTGTNFSVGSYTGNGVADRSVTITAANQPSLVWVKQTGAVNAVSRPATLSGDVSQYFANTANTTNRIKLFTSTGFTVGTGAEVNTNATTYRYVAWRMQPLGVLGADIVTAAGTSVAVPTIAMNTVGFPFDCSVTSGYLGTDSQRIRVANLSGTSAWTLSIAATGGAAGLWVNGGNSQQYDYNDPSGCSDGPDADTKAGKLQILPTAASITPQSGCATTNIALGSSQTFDETVADSVTIASATSGAPLNCYFDITNVELRQTIPAAQPSADYTIDLTLTVTAS